MFGNLISCIRCPRSVFQKTAQNELANLVNASRHQNRRTMHYEKFLTDDAAYSALGLCLYFRITAGGVCLRSFLNLFTKKKSTRWSALPVYRPSDVGPHHPEASRPRGSDKLHSYAIDKCERCRTAGLGYRRRHGASPLSRGLSLL